ncbi:hypothetical protein CBS101457_005408 [Exobasidium rhododendri]|nr:hypothetical protein CBS101457_005408 [Exobasidium rhododendri]
MIPATQDPSHMRRYSSSMSTSKSNHKNRNAGILLVLFICLLVYFIPTPQEILDAELAPPTPYTIKKSYIRQGSGFVFDYARVVGEKIPVPFKNGRNRKGENPLSNSHPHPAETYPDFQNKMYKLTADDWPTYEKTLTEFAKRSLPKQVGQWAISMVKNRSPARMSLRSQVGIRIPEQIWQTGKDIPDTRNSFQDKNPRASFNFYDDTLLESWAKQHFMGSLVKKTWDGMERVVLKADFWRYLVTFIEGGYYSDTDTDCLKPVAEWGKADAVVWDLGDKVSKEIAYGPPQVVVGIEVDVPDVTGWETFWPRPIQIVQWTMSGVPGHPIYLDSIRRVVDSMQTVKEWDAERKSKATELLKALTGESSTLKDRKKHFKDEELWNQLKALLTVDPFDKDHGGSMSLIEATGPGAFSDAVFSYLKARYGIHWSQLHNIQTATRIGEVAILPITGFAPFLKPDWQRWKGIERGPMSVVGDITHPQAMVNHQFSGSWRTNEDNAL